MLKPGATNLGPINPVSLAFGEILEFPFQTDVATRCFLFCQLKRFTNVPRDLSLRRFGYVLRFRVSGFRIQGFGKVFLMSCKRRARCMDMMFPFGLSSSHCELLVVEIVLVSLSCAAKNQQILRSNLKKQVPA